MRAGQRMPKGSDDGAEPVWGMPDAVDQVMGVLALETLVEREGLQASEADDVRMLDECGMLSAEIVPSVGNGCTRPPAI